MISNAEFTQQNYMCIHLVKHPDKFKEIYNIVKNYKLFERPSAEMQFGLDSLEKELYNLGTPTREDLKNIMNKFLLSNSDNVVEMGRSLSLGFDWLQD